MPLLFRLAWLEKHLYQGERQERDVAYSPYGSQRPTFVGGAVALRSVLALLSNRVYRIVCT